MMLPIVRYGHPALRKKGVPVESVTPTIRKLAADMLETMYENHGLGLAAQQVDEAIQLTTVDVRGVKDRPSTMEVNGQPVDVQARMPMVLINPQIKPTGEPVNGAEGCLSFPEIYADITRPGVIEVTALDAEGKTLTFACSGLLARVVQHEHDHLHGILFIDRMSKATKEELRSQLTELQAATKAALKSTA